MENLAEFLLSRDVPDDHPQSYFENEVYTIGDYRKVVSELTEDFRKNALPRNASAILIFDDHPLALALFLTCMKNGIVPVMVSTFILDTVLDKAVKATDASMIFSDGSRDLSRFQDKVILGELGGEMRPGKAELRIVNDPEGISPVEVDAERLAFFLMTSGSTGEPKIVEHVHGGMIFTTRVYAKETLGIGSDDSIYSIAKTSFGYGLANNLFFSFATGAPAWLEREQFDVSLFFERMERMKPTVMFGIPTAYRMLLDHVAEHPEDGEKFKGVRVFVSSGEALREDISREWKALTGRFIQDNMGSSEASAILLNAGNEEKYGSAGKPVKDSEVRLIGADGRDSDAGALYFKSEGNAVGYYKNPQENALHFKDGYLMTGDVFTIDEDGYFWYAGREDNMMKYHGFWVFPKEIERKILEFPGVREAVVTKATVDGIDIMAAALVTGEEFAGTDELSEFLEGELEMYKWPQEYLLFDEFPLNERGKVDLSTIKEMAEAEGAE